ncbi:MULTISPECIES: MMPL family transporter [unclassified Microbacterium]|uniref:MMPL family transporter n=1 Tax=unclassified Microbacterium TaxID=2609290 RepID=UPI00214C9001|nr:MULTISPECIES: MMPL family transporter [unclassified Microbacterium]MCR2784836.1 MMPL family transporter [Microbacterium sp. zg.B96]WIM16374.1 MMPL family transporter [Microbacterium sp. zg-B96]
MANLLFRLGTFSARRAWTVIVGWVIVLGMAGGAFLAFGGSLASSFSIPGTETERVNEQLSDTFPELTGASATAVFATDDGSAFSAEQQDEIAALLDDIAGVEGVAGVTDPFSVESERAQQAQQLDDGRAQLDAGIAELDAAEAQLTAGQQQLDAAIAQAQAAGMYDMAAAQFAQQQAQLDAGLAQIETGRTEIAEQAALLEDGAALMGLADEIRVVSADEATALGVIQLDATMFDLPQSVRDEVAGLLESADIAGVNIDYSSTLAATTEGLIGVGEIVGVVIAGLVLLIMMRAFLPAITPLLSSIVGVGVGVAGSLAFSGVVDMASVTPILGIMLGLAVGIDYSLFIMNRHRTQVLAGMEIGESVGLANGTAGNAVVFAGSTVIVALVALLVTGIPFLGVMGIVGAVCVLIAVLVSVTFTPALLGLLGTRVLTRKARGTIGHPDHVNREVRPMRTPRAIAAAALAIIALLVIAIPALSMRLGLPDGSSEATDTTQYRAYKTIEAEFGAGQNGPLLVVAEMPEAVAEADQAGTQIVLGTALSEQDGVVAVAPVAVSDDGTVFAFQVVPEGGPTSTTTEQLVQNLRSLSPVDGEITLGVAGQASGNIDVSEKLADALPVYLVVVVGLSLLIMILVFRSILVPVIATAGFVLSLFAALGAVTAIYQWGWLGDLFGVHDPGPVLSFAPIIIMGVLFGLAMDYQLFLVSGMREAYVHGMPARAAVVAGLRSGRAVVTAAAIIMASVFGGFVFSHLGMVRPLGFGLAIGVLFDAFVVRMVLVPAVMHLCGNAAWWLPKWLDRIMPDVDVEGAALERAHPVHGVAAEEPVRA